MLRYKVLHPLPGFTDCYALLDKWGNQPLALTLFDHPASVEELDAELNRRMSIRHPNILPILDIGWRGNRLGYITPLLSRLEPSPDPIGKRLFLAYDLVAALDALHRQRCVAGVLAPRQLLVSPTGDLIASFLRPGALFQKDRSRQADVEYCSPQVLEGGAQNPASDLYSLGLTLYWLLTDEHALLGDTEEVLRTKQAVGVPRRPREIKPEIPESVEVLLLDLLEKNASLRPSIAHALRVFADVTDQVPAGRSFSPPMIGRREIMSCLSRRLRQLRLKSTNSSHVIIGRSGIGKTTALNAFQRLARLEKVETIRFTQAKGDAPFESLRRLLSESTEKGTVDRLVRQLMAFQGPLAVACDDANWIDEATAGLLMRLMFRTAGATMVVTSVRGDLEQGPWKQVKNQLQMIGNHNIYRVAELNEYEIRELCTYATTDSPEVFAKDLGQASSGVPFYACEFLKAWMDRPSDVRSWARTPTNQHEVPSSILKNVIDRYMSLSRTERLLVDILAVLEQPIHRKLLLRIPGLSALGSKLTGPLLESELIAHFELGLNPEVALSHAWIGWIVRRQLSAKRAQEIRNEVIEGLDESCCQSDWIARQHARGGATRKGIPFLETAILEHARDGFHRAAADLVLEFPPDEICNTVPWRILKQSVQSLRIAGEYGSAIGLAREYMSAQNPDPRRKAWLLLTIAGMESLLPKHQASVQTTLRELFFESGKMHMSATNTLTASSILLTNLSGALKIRYRQQASQLYSFLIRYIDFSGTSHTPSNRKFLNALTIHARTMCDFLRSRNLVSRILQLHLSPISYSATTLSLAIDLVETDAPTGKTESIINEGKSVAIELGNAELLAMSLGIHSSALRRAGKHKGASQLALSIPQRGLQTLQGDFRKEVTAANECWELHPEGALSQVDTLPSEFHTWFDCRRIRNWSLYILGNVEEALSDSENNRLEPEVWKDDILAAHCHLSKGRAPIAWQLATAAAEQIPHYIPSHQARIRLLLAEILLAQRNPGEARSYALEGLAIAKGRFLFPWMATGYALVGQCEARLGNIRKARAFALRAEQVARQTDRPQVHILVHRTLGDIEGRAGRFAACRYRYGQALRILKEKLLHVSRENREGFRKLHIEPIEKERRRWIKPSSGDRNLLQRLSTFISGLEGSDTPSALAEKTVSALRRALPHLCCQFWFQGIGDARPQNIAASGKTSRSGRQFMSGDSSQPRLEIGTGGFANPADPTAVFLRIHTGPRAEALIYAESQTGEISEIELDYLYCLASIAEKRLPQIVREPSLSQVGTGIELDTGAKLMGRHPRMQTLFQQIQRIAPTTCTVLVLGESGTGKELVARAVHQLSSRQTEPFIALNCGAIPEGLIESELFGHRRGSFTGANQDRRGLFESAHRGTLFLDEISAMPLQLQARLLRVLQEKKIRRLGETSERRIDVRIVAAANQNMQALVESGEFRSDLYYRLKVVEIRIPPLRKRMGDIPLLAEYFLDRLNQENDEKRRFSPEALGRLARYPFPGNVRELQHVVESSFFLAGKQELGLEDIDLPENLRLLTQGDGPSRAELLYKRLSTGKGDFWKDVKDPFLDRELCREDVREIVGLALSAAGGNYRQVVRILGLATKDYRRLLNFLTHHGCKLDFRPYREQIGG